MQKRLDELGVGTKPTDELSEGVIDRSPEAIRARDLGKTGEVEITDTASNSWSGPEAEALEALADLVAGVEHREVWEQLVHA